METLNLISMGAGTQVGGVQYSFELAYEMAKSIRSKLQLSFSAHSSRWIAELDWAVKR